MHIVTRALYESALLINQRETVYEAGHTCHETALAAGLARLNGPLIELTHKGEEVIRLE
jgi:hypothetical protein